ncbi:Conserved putative membrane protein [Amycolatopsis japonica]|uniref:Conserved putative membrane protein n=1 Tax=Amycolatopsis japonica TaxID=208439 RepID=A0A075UPY9_9PSEU|nr:AAA family ATPase [Amycolatopsis japonica]AIG74574.1 Conserved putative membrane protein [Amycolatopsis japonica]
MNWSQLLVPVTSGVSVALIVATVRFLWRRTRLPTGLSQRMTRRNYLAEMLVISKNDNVDRLDALVPNLLPAQGSPVLVEIQESWTQINGRRGVRVITRTEPASLTAGAELLAAGIEVRVSRALTADHLSYHLFSGSEHHTVLNRRNGGKDRPERLDEISAAKVFRSHFDETWSESEPIESFLAGQLLAGPDSGLADRIREQRAAYQLPAKAEDAILRHLAFRHRAPVVFVTGLPGAGKSLVRRALAEELRRWRMQVDELNDYVYAFEEFLHALMLLGDGRGAGFSAQQGGAFQVEREDDLRPALHTLGHRVWENRRSNPITIVEFARADTIGALQVFGDEVLAASQIIHVRASDTERSARLARRGEPPKISVAGQSISLEVSDEHRLPSNAADTLYSRDDFALLKAQKNIANRLFLVENDAEEKAHVDEQVTAFVEAVVRPYRVLART